MHDILFRFITSIVGFNGKVTMGVGVEYIPGQVIVSSTARSTQDSAMSFTQEFLIDCLGVVENPWLANENAQLIYEFINFGQNQILNALVKSVHTLTMPYDNGFTPNGLKVVSFSISVSFISTEVNSLEVPKV